jgi:predicted ester cyclase
MSEAENKLLARRLLEEVVNTGAVERLPAFLASDCTNPYTGVQGLEWYREHVLTFRKCYPDLVVTVDGQVAEDDTVVTWWTMRGTNTGGWGGVGPTHKRIVLHGVNINKIRNARIVEEFGGSDSLEALMKLGVVQWVSGQQSAPANDGPTKPPSNSSTSGGPPSVS